MTKRIENKELLMTMGLFLGILSLEFLMATSSSMPWDSGINAVMASVSGPVATMVIIIAIVGAGGALIFAGGEMNGFMKSIVMVVLAGALILGATSFVTIIGGSGSGAVII